MLPVLIFAALALAFFTTKFLASHGLGRRWIQPFAAFSGALGGIVVAGLIAPSRKLLAGVTTSFALIYLASRVLERFDPITEQPTILPIGAGVLGGVLGLSIIAIPKFLLNKHSA